MNYMKSVSSVKTADRYSSNWAKARRASKSLKITWNINDNEASLNVGEDVVSDRRAVFSSVRKYLRESRTASLRDHRHQGKINECYTAAKASTHFFSTGAYTQFKEWRFVHKARLGVVKLNAYPWSGRAGRLTDKRCRKCGRDETLPHILNCCMCHSTLFRKRHDALVGWIKKSS